MRILGALVLLIVLAGAGAFVWAGRQPGPAIDIAAPTKFAGASTPVDVAVTAPGGALMSFTVAFEQKGTTTTLVTLDPARVTHDAADRLRAQATISKATVPALVSGPARLVVRAVRPVLFGLRQASSETARDLIVRLERPRIDVLSTHHYLNVGGTEMVVYRVTPADVDSGVSVGDDEYPGYPAAGVTAAGVHITDPAVRIAFFAMRYDQPASAPIQVYARDEAGNTAAATFDHKVFPKTFKSSRIPLDDAFLNRVVPAILAGTNEVKPGASLIDSFITLNGELRRKNADTIRGLAAKTAPDMLWQGEPFRPFINHAVESAFADHRTYVYQGREVDHQVHLGFDLASVTHAPVLAANRGRVIFAQELGIYGNCVILDHGMGVQSLYAHLSSIDVAVGALVSKDQPLGHSGKTGLAAGDHLHFTMLVGGRMVNPVEWWDPHWIQDRVIRKLQDVH